MKIGQLRLVQCPGCWAGGFAEVPEDGWWECDCGERMVVVDLRGAVTFRDLSVSAGSAGGEANG